MPLPAGLVNAVAPARASLEDHLRFGEGRWLTLSISPGDSLHAVTVFGASLLLYLSCRTLFAFRGVRDICRGVAWLGLILAAAAIAQRAVSPTLVLGLREAPPGALPFGPFVNRNHGATWLLMAIPLTFGYIGARLPRAGPVRLPAILHAIDTRGVVLLASAALMILSLMLSLSRSGLVAFAAMAVVFAAAVVRRMDRAAAVVTAAMAAAALGVAVKFAGIAPLLLRFTEPGIVGRFGRIAIWRDTLAAAGDFWLTGVGVGAYGTAMVVYQTGERTYHYNQAHSHYLHVLAEGGTLLTAATAVGAVLLLASAWQRLKADRSGVFWIRAGAASGLVGVAVQSVWETGLRMPANALLAAVLAALLTQGARPTRTEHETGGA